MIINIHTIVAKNSLLYFYYMVKNYQSLASGDNHLKFIAHCLDEATSIQIKNELPDCMVVKVYKEPKFFVIQTWRDTLRFLKAKLGIYTPMSGSNGHSAGLSSALSMVTPGLGVNIIGDTDAVILKKNWDIDLIQLLETYGILATCYEDVGGFSSGNGKVQTYKAKPNLTWMALSPIFDWAKFDPRPNKYKNIKIDSDSLSELYNLPLSFEMVCDVGWKMPSFLAQYNIPYKVFKQVKPTSDEARAIKTGNDYHEEYQLDGTPFLGHQRGSHKHPFRGNEISESFYNACDSYIHNQLV